MIAHQYLIRQQKSKTESLDFNIQANELNRLNNLMAKIVEENSNITDYKEMCQRDCFYDTKQALELGLIDKLL